MSLLLDKSRLLKLLAFVGLAWGPAMLALLLQSRSTIGPGTALVVALSGALAAAALAARTSIRRKPSPLRADPAGAQSDRAWNRRANPDANYANRWACYQDLSDWLAAQDWNGKAVGEFGHANGVLTTFMPGARYTLLEYPEHDIQDLSRVAADSFDLVVLDQTLEHVADPERALDQVHRILKPGGVLVVSTPFLVPLHGVDEYGDYTRWTPQGMATLLERHGYHADVRWWGNLAAARELLGRMHLTADQAIAQKLAIEPRGGEERYPVTVWALATARK